MAAVAARLNGQIQWPESVPPTADGAVLGKPTSSTFEHAAAVPVAAYTASQAEHDEHCAA
jgi:NADPH:quinone reductase-like Zn-dependent oxidoreductase